MPYASGSQTRWRTGVVRVKIIRTELPPDDVMDIISDLIKSIKSRSVSDTYGVQMS
jgi:hypothetical protein